MSIRTTLALVGCFALLVLISACADYKIHIAESERTWRDSFPDPDGVLDHTVFLVGDAGYSPPDDMAPALKLLRHQLKSAPENGTVVFLGDNIYPHGLYPEESSLRSRSQHMLDAQIDAVKDYPGNIFFIPGNHDWSQDNAVDGVERQEDYVQSRLEREHDVFIPDNGCSGPEVEDLTDDLALLAFDSNWYVSNWETKPKINGKCEIKSRQLFEMEFKDAVAKNKDKRLLIVQHHPYYSNGTHGGRFSSRQHLFPLTDLDPRYKVPLPILGSLGAFFRGAIGSRQDIAHPVFKDLRSAVLAHTAGFDNIVFASGHEHSLQLFVKEGHPFIISGSGSKESPTSGGRGLLYGYGRNGYAKLEYYESGEVWMEFWIPGEEKPIDGELVYRKRLLGKVKSDEELIPDEFPELAQYQGTINTSILGEREDISKGFGFFWGTHHRDLYFEKFDIPVLRLDTLNGGMTPYRRGGGFQTNSLRMRDAEGREYTMRSLKKDASRLVPATFSSDLVERIASEQLTAAHPFAAFVIPQLADAAGVYHTNPKLYYVPKQPALGVYNEFFGNELYLLEERPDEDWSSNPNFGNSDKIISTSDMLEKLADDGDDIIVDEELYVRSRLFDYVIGDWDRHGDQWRFGKTEKDENGEMVYIPIPRDRDQPFSRYDGFIPRILQRTDPFFRQTRSYDGEVPNVKWFNFHAQYIDRRFANQADRDMWIAQAEYIQQNLTDEAIERALRTWPDKVYERDGEEVAAFMRSRRDKLLEYANQYYDVLSETVSVVGTNKRDYFLIRRIDDERTQVQAFRMNKEGELKEKFYDRVFDHDVTREVRVYGLRKDDQFLVQGEVDKSILVRLIGGLGNDVFVDDSKVRGGTKRTKVYDSEEGNFLSLGSEGKDKTTDTRERNTYVYRDFSYDYSLLWPVLAFNPDDGVFLGAHYQLKDFGFKKYPYRAQHDIEASFAVASRAFNFGYRGDFIDVLGKGDLLVDADVMLPQFVQNYWGIGNNTENEFAGDRDNFDFNRVRMRQGNLYLAYKQGFRANTSYFSIGPRFQGVEVERDNDRFIAESDVTQLTGTDVFDPQFFGGVEGQIFIKSVDRPFNPSKGIELKLHTGWRANLQEFENNNGYFEGYFTAYQPLAKDDQLVLAMKVGGARLIGDYEFYHAAFIGGNNSIRGLRQDRFAGRSSVYHMTDLRYKLGTVRTKYFPFGIGVVGGFDYGRVWSDEPEDGTIHYSYGGGLFISPLDFFTVNIGAHQSDELLRFVISAGMVF